MGGCAISKRAVQPPVEKEEPNEYLLRRGGKFGKALENRTMAVIKGQYFAECLANGVPFAHRAKIEKEAPASIFDGKAAAEHWYKYGHRFLLVISYCWLAREHPDPNRFYLPYLKATVDSMKRKYLSEGATEIGVILDYMSFYQEPRTDDQKASFKECLNMINVPYGHQHVTAVKLVTVPTEENRTYDDRGWTKFESDVIDSKPTAEGCGYDGSLNVLTCDKPGMDMEAMAKCARRTPVVPSRFLVEMEERRKRAEDKGVRLFTNGKDQQFLEVKYAETFTMMAQSTTKLSFSLKNVGDAGAEQLAEALPSFHKLTELYLRHNNITPKGAKMLAEALRAGAAPKLEKLSLYENRVGDEGAHDLAQAIRAGAARKLKLLNLHTNNLGDKGARDLGQALLGGGAPQLNSLWIHGNNFTEEGKAALREVKQLRERDGGSFELHM